MTSSEFQEKLYGSKTRVLVTVIGEDFVLIQSQSVTNGQTERRTDN